MRSNEIGERIIFPSVLGKNKYGSIYFFSIAYLAFLQDFLVCLVNMCSQIFVFVNFIIFILMFKKHYHYIYLIRI